MSNVAENMKQIDNGISMLTRQRDALLNTLHDDQTHLSVADSLNLDGSPEHSLLVENTLRSFVRARNAFHDEQAQIMQDTLDKLRDMYRAEMQKI